MPNPLTSFVVEADRALDLVQGEHPSDEQLAEFIENQRRLEFLRDIVGRARMLRQSYDCLDSLSEQCREQHRRRQELPESRPGVRPIPQEFLDAEERWLAEVDCFTSLIYYEVTSIVTMLRQLSIGVDDKPELLFLVKLRDRFLSHVQLAGVRRGQRAGWSIGERGQLHRDVVALHSWTSEELRALGQNALTIGSSGWETQRVANEQLVLSRKRNENFTQAELAGLQAAGVRECDLEAALSQLAIVLQEHLLPALVREADLAIKRFGFERWPGVAVTGA
jgi:hypothetical protein